MLHIDINNRVIARKSFHVDGTTGEGHAAEIFRALASDTRVAILRYLGDRVVAVNQIAKDMGLPSSTATMHITVLERAGLIHTELRPASRGLQKVCARTYDELVFDLPRGPAPHRRRGGYRHADRWLLGLLASSRHVASSARPD